MKKINNGTLTVKDVGKTLTLDGWVNRKRDLGGLIFIDLRDRSGLVQLVIKPETEVYKVALELKNEYVIEVTGKVVKRQDANPNLPTGEIEVEVANLTILNVAKDLPFDITTNMTALEDTRLKYRYLDLRRAELQKNFIMRHKIVLAVRNFLDKKGFLEVETPVLCKSTPEGARDYLVPSRVNKGKFYALPQSPQLFKQLLMIGGFERYFQIAKCFRDEDLRADRQPEFTQIDMEMSFVKEEDVMAIAEELVAHVFKEIKGIDIKLPLLRMRYDDAIDKYGIDKPDLRFGMPIEDINAVFASTKIEFLKNILTDGIINALVVKGASTKYSRKEIDKLKEFVKTYKATNLIYLKYENGSLDGGLKDLSETETSALIKKLNLENGDLILMVAGPKNIVKTSLGALRNKLGHDLNLIAPDDYKLLWVTDFPLFEYSEEDKRYYACHHPFTSPKDEDLAKVLTDPGSCYAKAYDIVINGYEAGGGSIRIHDQEVQAKMFEALGFTKEEAKRRFGFFLEAFQYGAPPHGGIAFGLDRFVMLLLGTENIRDVIAFPKTASASDIMCEAPNIVDEAQLKELGIEIRK